MRENFFKQAKEIQNELIIYRRYLHENAETGFELSKTKAFVIQTLRKMGYEPKECGKSGVVVTVGKKSGKAFLLRADMDALPIQEQTGLSFACKTGNMHACGHDMHTAMLLGAAKLLKKREKTLQGAVKLLFQPAEEILQGAKDCIESGVLTSPEVDGAMMLHVATGISLPAGSVFIPCSGASAPAADYFTVEIQGKGCHGAAPQNGVDAINAAAHTVIALQEILSREISGDQPAVMTVGKIQGGEAANAIADRAALQGTLRATDEEVRQTLKKRLEEISIGVAKTFRATAKVQFDGGCPVLQNNEKLLQFIENVLKNSSIKEKILSAAQQHDRRASVGGGSEDFAYIAQKTPSVCLSIAAGEAEKGYDYSLHHPKAIFDESVLYIGSAVMATIAFEWAQTKR